MTSAKISFLTIAYAICTAQIDSKVYNKYLTIAYAYFIMLFDFINSKKLTLKFYNK